MRRLEHRVAGTGACCQRGEQVAGRPLEVEARRAIPSLCQFDYLHLSELAGDLEREIHRFRHAADRAPRVIDVGCGASPYRHMFRPGPTPGRSANNPRRADGPHGECAGPPGGPDYVRLDPDMRARPDVVAEASRLPFRGACFDVLLCTQALQYVADPVGAVREFTRVLRPGGLALVSTHGRWPVAGTTPEHRWNPSGLAELFAPFESSAILPEGTSLSGAMQRANLRVRAAARGAETRLGAAGRLLAACASLAHGTLNLVALAGRRLAPRRVECAHWDAACVDGAALNYLVIARAPAGAGARHGASLGAGSGGE